MSCDMNYCFISVNRSDMKVHHSSSTIHIALLFHRKSGREKGGMQAPSPSVCSFENIGMLNQFMPFIDIVSLDFDLCLSFILHYDVIIDFEYEREITSHIFYSTTTLCVNHTHTKHKIIQGN